MDEDNVERQFFNIAMGDYKDSLEKFVEHIRVMELHLRAALAEQDMEQVAHLSGEMFMASTSIQVANVANAFIAFAHNVNEERAAGVEQFDLIRAHLDKLRKFHQHLVFIGQPNEELAMVTDMMAELQENLDSSAYGQMLANGQ